MCTQFCNGNVKTLFQAALPRERHRPVSQAPRTAAPVHTRTPKHRIARAMEYAKKGNLSKCCKILDQADQADNTMPVDDIVRTLREKHPAPSPDAAPLPRGR
eukprot:2482010-Rhodomonas_salina.1